MYTKLIKTKKYFPTIEAHHDINANNARYMFSNLPKSTFDMEIQHHKEWNTFKESSTNVMKISIQRHHWHFTWKKRKEEKAGGNNNNNNMKRREASITITCLRRFIVMCAIGTLEQDRSTGSNSHQQKYRCLFSCLLCN